METLAPYLFASLTDLRDARRVLGVAGVIAAEAASVSTDGGSAGVSMSGRGAGSDAEMTRGDAGG